MWQLYYSNNLNIKKHFIACEWHKPARSVTIRIFVTLLTPSESRVHSQSPSPKLAPQIVLHLLQLVALSNMG